MLDQKRPPPRLQFFAPLEVALTPGKLEAVGFAYIASKYGHKGQSRDDGNRYFDHPKAAAWIYISELGGLDERVIIDVLLHDLCEDTYLLSPYRINVNFDIEIARDIQALSKLKGVEEPTNDYLNRIIGRGPHAVIAKLLDRLHNARTCEARTQEKRLDLIEETSQYHLPMLIPALRIQGDGWAACAERLEAKFAEALSALAE